MASGGQRKRRADRVAGVAVIPSSWRQAWARLRTGDVLLRLTLALVAAAGICLIVDGWRPPLAFHSGDLCRRDVVARVAFTVVDEHSPERKPIHYSAGQTLLTAGQIIQPGHIKILRAEREAALAGRHWTEPVLHAAAVSVLVLALFALTAVYLWNREPSVLTDLGRLSTLLVLVLIVVALCRWASADHWRAALVPLLLFGQVVTVAYRQESGLLLSSVLALLVVLVLGYAVQDLLVFVGVTATAILQLGRVRSRTKLFYVALVASAAAFVLTTCAGILEDHTLHWLVIEAAFRNVLWTIVAGVLMTVILLFVERLFGVLTDISLLELADMSKRLLQELVQRAPGTYNHSIIVGTLAEAAAEAIGARGLLARVGAYYHDVGKMLQPEYYVENQAPGDNRHEGLVPTMSKLVIVAHVKDGVDLARKHRLPQPIIDLLEQHHGTTLVEYFYNRAAEQRRRNPDEAEVEETTFRYPGPKPRSKEAAVLMLADAAESACRSLVDPAPGRIEAVVRGISKRRLEDGQFDESGLTLKELRMVEDSLIKSLVATYHARIKYPTQQTA